MVRRHASYVEELGISMVWSLLIITVALVAPRAIAQNVNVGRLLRFSCSQLVIERTDPLVNPGVNPSTHVHQIVGGNSFNVTVRHARVRAPFLIVAEMR